MGLLDKTQNLPLKKRKRLAMGFVVFLSLVGFGIWALTDFGLSTSTGGLGVVQEGADEVASLIQEQTEQYAVERQELEENLDQVLRSSALILPDGIADLDEEPEGVLFLGKQYRERGVLVTFDQIEFYPSTAIAVFTVTKERDEPVFLDAALGSALAQAIPATGANITYRPLFQAGSPAELTMGQPLELVIVFGPANSREPFEIILGDFTNDDDPQIPDRWSASFSVDPLEIVDESDTSF